MQFGVTVNPHGWKSAQIRTSITLRLLQQGSLLVKSHQEIRTVFQKFPRCIQTSSKSITGFLADTKDAAGSEDASELGKGLQFVDKEK